MKLRNDSPLYIFDLDGTLADTAHRAHYLHDKEDSHRWRKFYAACVHDKPNEPVVRTFKELAYYNDVWVWSGRSKEVIDETFAWMKEHLEADREWFDSCVMMREVGDYTQDHVLKKRWLDSMLENDRKRLVAIFDDRKSVVDMWRSNGVACFQVAPGEF